MKVDILAIGAHPDDIELSCSGTLLRHIDQGKTVGLCDLTKGELGTRGNEVIRMKEAEQASQLMTATFRVNCGMEDGFFEYNRTNIEKIVQIIRWSKPSIVLANAIEDRHPDHGKAAKLIADACFLAGLRKVSTQFKGESQDAWRPKAIYHYIQDHHLQADFAVDISDYIDKKMELIMAFKSQFFDPDSKEPESPISGKDFLEFIKSRNRDFGRPAGFEYAEGYTVSRIPGIQDLFSLK